MPMDITTMTSREFNRDTSGAKRAARRGPVYITDRGRAAHVLLSIEQYEQLSGAGASIATMLALPGADDIDFEAPRLGSFWRPSDLS